MTIKTKVNQALKPIGIPVGHYSLTDPKNDYYITFFVYDVEYIRCDDKLYISAYTIQVDLWSKKSEYQEYEEKIKSAMEDADFYLDDEEELYEFDTKLFHKGMRFVLEKINF